ncbi:MAG: hypothetical protein H0W08_08225 [Acidobacteria bacterium]|nr:hypothetical protein [Acidobacteriota bacterium]
MIGAYLKERFAPVVFVPLAVAIALIAAGGRYGIAMIVTDALAALLLLAELRLWDDLADRHTDRSIHPDRVVVQSRTIRPLVLLCAALAIVNLGWSVVRDGSSISVAVLIVMHAALGTWYVRREGRTFAGDQLLLAKYPAFVFIVAGARLAEMPVTITLLAAALYVAVSAYEAWHDPVSPLGFLLGGRS